MLNIKDCITMNKLKTTSGKKLIINIPDMTSLGHNELTSKIDDKYSEKDDIRK